MKNATALIVLGILAVLAAVDARSPTSKSYLESLRSGTVCPDKEYSCSDGQTCCKLKAGGFGCCGMANAVCCKDGQHCCPHGTKCDLDMGTCVRSQGVSLD